MFTKLSRYVEKKLPALLGVTICCLSLFISCPMAPPEDPAKGLNPYLSPSAPIIESITNGLDSSITIRWNESPNATSYEVWGISSSDFGTIDIPSFYKMNGDNTGYDPAIKGFQFFADIEETSYTLSNLSADSAFVFCLRAVRDLGDQVSTSNRLLYSAPSAYVEGSTKGSVALQVLATTKSVKLLWNVGNLFKVLPNVSGAKEPLYSCMFDVLYSVHGSSQFVALPNAEGLTTFSYSIPTSSTLLDSRNTYDFQVRMTITTSSGTTIYVTSDAVSVQPEQNLVPERISGIDVSQGMFADGIELVWRTPSVPVGLKPDPIFIVDRQRSGENDWETVLDQSLTQFGNAGNPLYKAENEAYVWKDTSVVDNTTYKYRVWNGYRFGQVIFLQNEVNDSGENNITESNGYGWSVWRVDGQLSLTESDLVYCESPSTALKSETVTLTWTYRQTFNPSVTKWFLEKRCWNQKTGITVAEESEISPTVLNNVYTYSENLSLNDIEDPTYQKTYSYTLKIKLVDDSVFQSVAADKDTSLGQPQIAYFDTVTATQNQAKSVKLSWILHKDKVLEGASPTDTQIWNDIINNKPDAISYMIRYSDAGSIDNEIDNSNCTFKVTESSDGKSAVVVCSFDPNSQDDRIYRIAATLRNTTTAFNSPESVSGRPLPVPSGLTATKGISQESIALSWTAPSVSSDVVYRLYRRPAGGNDASWTVVCKFDDVSKVTYNDAHDAGTANAGAIYDYALDAYNSVQSPEGLVCTDKTPVVQGCLFGAKLTNIQASDATESQKIVITWDNVEGATKYKIMRRLKGSDNAFYNVTALTATTENTTYLAEDTGIVKQERTAQNPYPLSAQYEYIVQPIREVEGAEALTVAEDKCPVDSGFLFAPPENIQATVSRSTTSIDISWNAVKKIDATGNLVDDTDVSYQVYFIDGKTGTPTENTSWNFLKTVTTTSTTHTSLKDAERYYNVVAVKQVSEASQLKSEFQKSFPDGKSYCYGATLNAPSTLSVVRDKVKGVTKVSWKAVPNVTSYVVYGLPGIEVGKELDVSSVTGLGTNNGLAVDSVGFIELDGEGAYTYCLEYTEYASTYQPITISSKNVGSGVEYESGRSANAYFRLTALEIINIINTVVKESIQLVNEKVGGDWWNGDAWNFAATDTKVYQNKNTNIAIHWGGVSLTNGSLNMDNAYGTGIDLKLNTIETVVLRPADEGNLGFLGTDPLKYIGYEEQGLISVDFMDSNNSPVSVTMKYKNVDATASTNSADKFELTVNGTVVPSSDLAGTIVMPY